MANKEKMEQFNETHHALLFAWLSEAIIGRVGVQKGEFVIRKAIRQYGEERGRRMLLRARAKKHELNMINYLGYREYNITAGAMDMKISSKLPDGIIRITTCPWYKAWKENDMMEVGKLYCAEVDSALLRSFNPELHLEMTRNLPFGDNQCEFIYRGANLTIPNIILFGYRKAVNPGPKAVKPWDYHVGHLFSTFEKVFYNELGKEGQQAINGGLTKFTERYGEQARQKVLLSRSVNYNSVRAD